MSAQVKLRPQSVSSASPLRFISATSLFDGHDASINVIRRLIQDQGAEVIHLGHNRAVEEIVHAALQEDVDGIAVSSYQGGHMEFFPYLIDRLRYHGAAHIQVFGGGGGTISAEEAKQIESYGVNKIYSPEDGLKLGLKGMIEDLIDRTRAGAVAAAAASPLPLRSMQSRDIGRALSIIEDAEAADALLDEIAPRVDMTVPVLGISGTGGAGKSTVADELLAHFLRDYPELRIAVLAIDPTRYRTGGALLGDRIRMNNAISPRVFMRSMATRRRHLATNAMLNACIAYLRSLEFGLLLVETVGIGQADSEIADLADLSLYIMTSDYGSSGQLEKIEMLDRADFIVLNKCDKPGSADALRDIRKQWRRCHQQFAMGDGEIPVFPAVATRFDDPAIGGVYHRLSTELRRRFGAPWAAREVGAGDAACAPLIPFARLRYLAEISDCIRREKRAIQTQIDAASRAHGYHQSLQALADPELPPPLEPYAQAALDGAPESGITALRRHYQRALGRLDGATRALLRAWDGTKRAYQSRVYRYQVRGKQYQGSNYTESLGHLQIPKVVLPQYRSWGELTDFLLNEQLPGHYPYTAGVFPYRRDFEEPTRMFAGEGAPERTNRRFHLLSQGQPTIRLSTAFDPVTLYGQDPAARPDVFGNIGMSGVSAATVDDIKKLYSGIDLCDANTSVSLTINGPAPMILAMFFNAAIDQQVEKYLRENGDWPRVERNLDRLFANRRRPAYHGRRPAGHNGLGLGLLGVSGRDVIDAEHYQRIRKHAFEKIRGTVQADILKEDQAQNECLFAIECGLRMMGDIQAFFIDHAIHNFYSVSVSGYHIAEAGANPVTQLAFTLANAFTLTEYYLARGMKIDAFARNMSFFFSNGMDPEYAVIGRVARRIWARAMKLFYHADPRSQKLKYHIQTSGRSLHAREIAFNDIRTTLQAIYAINDNCDSLHTNAYDEAVTTPTEESVRRALAIQMIINREFGASRIQNSLQGSFAIEALTDLVEEAVLDEFNNLSERGGVLGAMGTQYQRARIQEESLHYERCKEEGKLPIIGVNSFVAGNARKQPVRKHDVVRSSVAEKQRRIDEVERFKCRNAALSSAALLRLQNAVRGHENTFEELMNTVNYCTLGQITATINQIGGQYKRRI